MIDSQHLGKLLGAAAIATALAGAGNDLAAQDEEAKADSVVLREMHELQAEFEQFRERRTPVESGREGGGCDERIGRMCIWFGGEEEAEFPAELREVGQARVDLIRELLSAFDQVNDPWILGQLVHYLVENRTMDEAQRVATACGIAEEWWCHALHGYVLHIWTRYVEAEQAFNQSLELMPDEEWEEWMTPRYIFTRDAEADFKRMTPLDQDLKWELFWRLSDPLFIFEGNDRLTDHFARWVIAKNKRDAADPMNMEWDEDIEETLIRYGRNMGYSRGYDPGRSFNRGALTDTRRMIGHHHPKSRGYLFPEEYLESPSDIPPESWLTAPREARTWYAAPYAPDIRSLETQVGRFRRDDRMLVVGAYRPTLPDPESGSETFAWGAGTGVEDPPITALFLIPENGEDPIFVRGEDPEGVLTIETWPGRYVSGLEVVDLPNRQAWRARQGIVQLPLPHGIVGVSDLMILKEDAPLPESLDDALPHIRPGVRIRQGERFGMLWEVYGLQIQESVRVTIGFSPGRPGFLQRVGDFLGIIEPEESVDITFEDTGPDVLQTVFRSIELELPDLEPGEYTLHLRLDLPGREPVIKSRPIFVDIG